MWPVSAHPADRRAEALRLLRETDLTFDAIGARLGISPGTIRTWNTRAGWPRPPCGSPRLAIGRWPAERQAALVRVLCAPGLDPADVTEVLGLGRLPAKTMVSALSKLQRPPAGAPRIDHGAATDPAILRAHLRAHIARQIAAFDAALSGEGAALRDSARVLRDLAGLTRLVEALAADGARCPEGEGGDGDTEPDLPALRADIARRYAGFVGGRASA
ncbi:helix-turn-helix domain-containing protein [Methylobacterium sp. J-070]|uniref:helix-turn-helix domain-containing protein n=1 Tax=Methylobacterium sp. J-070 TaxID=2836650 RepID=UPI001FB9967D|nr:helix-turn-helix domain-containing protein [Methylobacterium sp. J-070]MCJ2049678.1 hypothetical protein [Methylobacterium sp. J-070]